MAILSSHGDFLAIAVSNMLLVFSKTSAKCVLRYKHCLLDGEGKSDAKGDAEATYDFVGHAFSKDGTRLAAITDNKKLLVWSVVTWKQVHDSLIPRRPTSLDFSSDSDTVVVADKTGDVYKYLVSASADMHPVLLLGHLSMVLDVRLAPNDRYIITADRDEKIRVSLFPLSYIIHSYCLGHTRLVTCLQVISDTLLISAGGDGTIRLWNYNEGEQLDVIDVDSILDETPCKIISKLVYSDGDLCATVERCSKLLFFKVNCSGLRLSQIESLDAPPSSVCLLSEECLVAAVPVASNPLVCFVRSCQSQMYERAKAYPDLCEAVASERLWCSADGEGVTSFYADLLKPGKRSASTITPEATINMKPGKIPRSNDLSIDSAGEEMAEE